MCLASDLRSQLSQYWQGPGEARAFIFVKELAIRKPSETRTTARDFLAYDSYGATADTYEHDPVRPYEMVEST